MYNKKIQKVLQALSDALSQGYAEENVDVYFGSNIYLMYHSRHNSSPIGNVICPAKGINKKKLQNAIDDRYEFVCVCEE